MFLTQNNLASNYYIVDGSIEGNQKESFFSEATSYFVQTLETVSEYRVKLTSPYK